MIHRLNTLLLVFCVSVILSGCSVLFSEQEWSENYALLGGTRSSSSKMIDGDLNTIGEAGTSKGLNLSVGLTPAPEVIITLPERKIIRRIVIHSENIKKFNIYADKGGNAISTTDWKLIKEAQSVKSNTIILPIMYSFPTDKIRLVVLGTTDDAALTRKHSTSRILSTAGTLSSGST